MNLFLQNRLEVHLYKDEKKIICPLYKLLITEFSSVALTTVVILYQTPKNKRSIYINK